VSLPVRAELYWPFVVSLSNHERYEPHCPFVLSLSKHERSTISSLVPFDKLRAGFDKLRASGRNSSFPKVESIARSCSACQSIKGGLIST
ncbi:MAG TPA: hypothetical protein PKY71_07940, partial [Smithellaceae bacterium]|nr:hypothetical protein [Smithellaceae bacterium]